MENLWIKQANLSSKWGQISRYVTPYLKNYNFEIPIPNNL